MSDASLRLFVGVGVPELQLTAVDKSVTPVKAKLATARWVSVPNQHVTMKFLGWVPGQLAREVVDAARTAATGRTPWTTELTHLGAFPSTRRARVLWVGLDDRQGAMSSLAAAIDEAVEPLGFEPEKRAFTPHLTLARLKVPGRIPDLGDLVDEARRPFRIDELRIYRSHLSPRGARYEIVERLLLGGEREP
jgi:RNA 2',3'-cyclic 3'-phosphodiesterase